MRNKAFFLILAAFCFSLTASLFDGNVYRGAVLVCLLALLFKQLPQKLPFTMLSAAVVFFSLYFLAHMLFLNSRYRSAGIYQPLYLLLPFVVFSCIEKETVKRTFKYGVFVLLFLSFWGLLQHFTGLGVIVYSGGRANAIFYTPNTFATAINLFLLPAIVFYACGRGIKKVFLCVLIFYAALLATSSRGGYLALTTGFLFLISFLRWQIIKECKQRFLTVVLGLAGVTMIFKLLGAVGLSNWNADRVVDIFRYGGQSYRIELYSIAWKLIKENPWLGIGNFNFNPLFEIHKIPSFITWTTNYVHNDYLQFWLENGLIGLLALLSVIVSFYSSVFKKREEILKQQPPVLIMAGAAVTSIFAHAVVDFPLYIPALLVVLGAFLGAANRELTDMGITQFQFPISALFEKIGLSLNRIGLRTEFLRKVTVSLIMLWLAMPILAWAAADIGLRKLMKGDARGGLYWHSIARNLEPRNTLYYWREGIIWRDQATTLENSDAAQKAAEKADKLFLAGLNANPYYDTQNLVARILLHRDNRNLLEKPATVEELVFWAERLRSRDPHSRGAQVEYVRTLAFAGKKREAVLFARQMQSKNPESKAIKKLINDLEQGVY